MKRWLNIFILMLGVVLIVPLHADDDYVDDIYYQPETEISTTSLEPSYNKNAREIVFIEDSTELPNDTVVKAIIRK